MLRPTLEEVCTPAVTSLMTLQGQESSGKIGGNVFLVLHREEGQGLAEYALILSLIALLAIGGLTFISGNLNAWLTMIGSNL